MRNTKEVKFSDLVVGDRFHMTHSNGSLIYSESGTPWTYEKISARRAAKFGYANVSGGTFSIRPSRMVLVKVR